MAMVFSGSRYGKSAWHPWGMVSDQLFTSDHQIHNSNMYFLQALPSCILRLPLVLAIIALIAGHGCWQSLPCLQSSRSQLSHSAQSRPSTFFSTKMMSMELKKVWKILIFKALMSMLFSPAVAEGDDWGSRWDGRDEAGAGVHEACPKGGGLTL